MKNVRIFLSVFALVLGVGGTIAGQVRALTSMTGFEYVPATGACIKRTVECNTSDTNLCTWTNGNKVGANSTQSECGAQLKRK